MPGLEPGDVVIVLDQKEHPVFQRIGNNLVLRKEISLVDALCGFRQVVHTLDNRALLVSSQHGESATWSCQDSWVLFLGGEWLEQWGLDTRTPGFCSQVWERCGV